MKFQINDIVEFTDAVGGGKIVKIVDGLYHVDIGDGFDIPYNENKLRLVQKAGTDFIYADTEELEQEVTVAPKEQFPEADVENLFLALYKNEYDEPVIEFVNNTGYSVFVSISCYKDSKLEPIYSKSLHSGSIAKLPEANISYSSTLSVQVIYIPESGMSKLATIDRDIKLTKSMYTTVETNSYFDYKVNLYNLAEQCYDFDYDADEIEAAMLEKKLNQKSDKRFSKNHKPEDTVKEIDLHINKLVDSVVGLSNFEILSKQIEVFIQELDDAITKKHRRIIFIHGIGNGTLKDKIRQILEVDYMTCSYEDAPMKEYGVGATLINLH